MSENDSKVSARFVNPESDDFMGPILILGEVYSRGELIRRTKASPATFTKWRKVGGLEPLESCTQIDVFLADDVIAAWREIGRKKREGAK